MKKFVSSTLFFSLLVLGISSCTKKDYTCICRSTVTSKEEARSTISTNSTSKAASECDDKQFLYAGVKCDIQF